MAPTIISGGFRIAPASVAEATEDTGPETLYEELARRLVANMRQGNGRAALDQGVELVNHIAALYDLAGGAWA